MNALIAESRFRWQNSPVFDFSKVAPSLTKGAGNNAEVVLVEFADFLCPHCKTAATTLGAFVKTRPNVRLDFFAFPLDGACNASIPEATSSLRCWLAGAVYCGGKLEPAASGGSNWGWRLQEEFFQGQSTWGGLRAREDFEKQLIGLTGPDVGARLIACLADPSTTEALRAQAKVGAEAGVKGTPAIFINGRRVMAGQYLSVLEDIYARSK
jgi:protein-disulfide isomerase